MPWKQWTPGDQITINRVVWDGLESENIQDVLERDWFGPGKYAAELEKALASYIGTKHAQLTNSGSSALLLGCQALQQLGIWQKGDLILHPACTFPTSCNPIWQSSMIPVFVDVEEGTYNLDLEKVIRAVGAYRIKGAIIPHLIGNSPQMDAIVELFEKYVPNYGLIEDCCDTLGSEYAGRKVGTFGHLACFSFYGSHHITTAGVGGALLTNDDKIARLVKSMAFWGRQFVNTNDPYYDFTQRYTYETIGYDMQMSELQAAFGLAQIARLDEGNQGRANQFRLTDAFMRHYSEWLITPRSHPQAAPSWFGYPITVRGDAPFGREALARHLLANKIEIRPLFAGNLTRQPAYQGVPYIIAGELTQSNRNREAALFLPCWGGMTDEQTAFMFDVIERFMSQW